MRPRGGDGKKKGREGSVVGRRNPHGPYGIVGERIVWASAPASGFEPGPPATGRACCRYTSGPSAGRPRTGVCHHPSGWSAVDRVLPALRHTTVVRQGVTVRRAHPADATGRTDRPRPGPPSRTAIRGERPQASRCVIRRSNRGQPRECGECIVCRHPGGLGQEPHAATQGTPPTAGWVSRPIPRTRWGVDGRADGMGTARPFLGLFLLFVVNSPADWPCGRPDARFFAPDLAEATFVGVGLC